MKRNTNFDAVVIGSGIGGLATAGLLSKLYDKRVLLLEQHSEPGGCTHSFQGSTRGASRNSSPGNVGR